MDPLAIKFEEEIRAKMLHAKKECRYNPTRFNQMLAKYGGVETANCKCSPNRKYIRRFCYAVSLREIRFNDGKFCLQT